MALRNLAAKVRIPASAAPRLLPASGSRARPYSSNSPPSPTKVARDWYLVQRARYDGVTRELTTLHRVVRWTEKLEVVLRRFYLVGAPLGAAGVFVEWQELREAEAVSQ
ncbi:unnamed protein product [Alopecurus aequalis]